MVLVDGNKQAETLAELVETFFDLLVTSDIPRPQIIPALDVLPAQRLSPHSRSASGAPSDCGGWPTDACRSRSRRWPRRCCAPRAPISTGNWRSRCAWTKRSRSNDLIAHLESIGYEKREPVEMIGEYSLRGGILDIFPAEASKPVRIELFGDLIESIRRFDVETQRSMLKMAETTLLPLVEYPKSRAGAAGDRRADGCAQPRRYVSRLGVPGAAGAAARQHSLLSLIENPLVVLDEPEQIAAAAERLWKRLEDPDRPSPCSTRSECFITGASCVSQIQDKAELQLRELELG